jgi:hypothetical protein
MKVSLQVPNGTTVTVFQNTAYNLCRFVPLPVKGIVFIGIGAVMEGYTHSIPVINLKGKHRKRKNVSIILYQSFNCNIYSFT